MQYLAYVRAQKGLVSLPCVIAATALMVGSHIEPLRLGIAAVHLPIVCLAAELGLLYERCLNTKGARE